MNQEYAQRFHYERRDVEHKIAAIFTGFAGEMAFPDTRVCEPSFFGLAPDPHPVPNVETRTFEIAHYYPKGIGETLGEAYSEFELNARFPWQSIKDRFTIAWRRRPKIEFDNDFEREKPIIKITARYALILDYEPFEKAK